MCKKGSAKMSKNNVYTITRLALKRPIMPLMGNQPTHWCACTSRLLLYRILSEICGVE